MERETKTFTTPISKQSVVVKTYLTGREKRALTNVFLQGGLSFNADTKNVSGIDFKLVDQEQDLTLRTVIVSIDGKKDGEAVEGSAPFSVVDAVLDMRAEDMEAVVKEINAVKGDASFEEKKTA